MFFKLKNRLIIWENMIFVCIYFFIYFIINYFDHHDFKNKIIAISSILKTFSDYPAVQFPGPINTTLMFDLANFLTYYDMYSYNIQRLFIFIISYIIFIIINIISLK